VVLAITVPHVIIMPWLEDSAFKLIVAEVKIALWEYHITQKQIEMQINLAFL